MNKFIIKFVTKMLKSQNDSRMLLKKILKELEELKEHEKKRSDNDKK